MGSNGFKGGDDDFYFLPLSAAEPDNACTTTDANFAADLKLLGKLAPQARVVVVHFLREARAAGHDISLQPIFQKLDQLGMSASSMGNSAAVLMTNTMDALQSSATAELSHLYGEFTSTIRVAFRGGPKDPKENPTLWLETRKRELTQIAHRVGLVSRQSSWTSAMHFEHPGTAAKKPPANANAILTLEQLRAIMPSLPKSKAQTYLPFLNKAMGEGEITTPLRQAAFLAQLAHESVQLVYFEEIASGAAYEGRKDLGNTKPGDGKRYKGRGPIQLTGRTNYRLCGVALGLKLEDNPELAALPENGFRVAVWFWTTRALNAKADAQDFDGITKKINGGFNGKKDRDMFYARAKRVLGSPGATTASTTTPPTTTASHGSTSDATHHHDADHKNKGVQGKGRDSKSWGLLSAAEEGARLLLAEFDFLTINSGRRDAASQAGAMAGNVIVMKVSLCKSCAKEHDGRGFIRCTYKSSTLKNKLQAWVDAHETDRQNRQKAANAFTSILTSAPTAELMGFSQHLSGMCFDLQPVAEYEKAVFDAVAKLPGVNPSQVFKNEAGQRRWHIGFH
jgi:predicted chitinase